MLNRTKHAFTLIELLLMLLLIGVIASVFMPLILRRPTHDTWVHVLDDLNNIVFYTRQEAISRQKTLRITFKRPKGESADSVFIEEETKDPEHPSRFLYIPVTSTIFQQRILFPLL